MNYFRLSVKLDEDGAFLFSEISEHDLADATFEVGTWERPITRIISSDVNFDFIALEKDYLEAFLAGIATKMELDAYHERFTKTIGVREDEPGKSDCDDPGISAGSCGSPECCRGTGG